MAWTSARLPWSLEFRGPETKFRQFSIAKYGILDLTYSVAGIEWMHEDQGGISLLTEMGFVQSPTESFLPEGEDPTCLTELEEDVARNEVLLRLFIENKPKEFDDPEYVRGLVLDGRVQRIMKASADGDVLRRLVDEHFPGYFIVSDACITNADFIWFHKHFYW